VNRFVFSFIRCGRRVWATVPRPEGALGLSLGFQPQEHSTPPRRAPKGRQRTTRKTAHFAPENEDDVRSSMPAPAKRMAITLPFHVLGPIDLAPFQGALRRGRFPGLKPRAESSGPFGAKARSIFHILNFPRERTSNFVTTLKGADFWHLSRPLIPTARRRYSIL
jgi:hypothetical protein